MSTIHVTPVNDLIEHLDDYCPCGPDVEAVFREDGSNGSSSPATTHHPSGTPKSTPSLNAPNG